MIQAPQQHLLKCKDTDCLQLRQQWLRLMMMFIYPETTISLGPDCDGDTTLSLAVVIYLTIGLTEAQPIRLLSSFSWVEMNLNTAPQANYIY